MLGLDSLSKASLCRLFEQRRVVSGLVRMCGNRFIGGLQVAESLRFGVDLSLEETMGGAASAGAAHAFYGEVVDFLNAQLRNLKAASSFHEGLKIYC